MNWKVCLSILTSNVIFMAATYTMLIPFLPMYLTKELGVTAGTVNIWSGIVFSATFVISAFMAPIWGRLADKKGKRLMAVRSSLLLTITYFMGGLVHTPLQLVFVRIFQGFAAGLWPMELALMSTYAPLKKQGFCLGVMQGALTAGSVIGPLFGGFLADCFGMRMSFFMAAAVLFLNTLVLLFCIKETPPVTAVSDSRTDRPSLWKNPLIRRMLIYAVFVQMVILLIQPVLTLYIQNMTGPIHNIIFISGLVFSLGGIASAASSPLWGRFGQFHGFRKSLTIAAACAGICFLIQAVPNHLYYFAATQFAVGLFFSGLYPSINALLAENTTSQEKGSVFGLLFSAQQIGSIVGPLAGSAIAVCFGMKYIFIVAGLILLAMSASLYKKPA